MDIRYSKCALTFNGIVLDKEIGNYSTINVEGRQLLPPKLNIVTIPGRNGDIVLGQQYDARDIVVHFYLQEDNNFRFLEKIKRINHILHTSEDVPFSFRDEKGFRLGRVSDVKDPPYDSNAGLGSFTIHCSDPFLYRELNKTNSNMPDLWYKKYPVKIEEIKINLITTKKVVLRNITRGTKIVLNDNFSSGVLSIKKDTITVNGENKLNCLDFAESDYQNFNLYSGDKISVSPKMSYEITFRERIL